jgi:hypothetical protein
VLNAVRVSLLPEPVRVKLEAEFKSEFTRLRQIQLSD